MAVGQAIKLEQFGSTATLHKRISELRAEGFLDVMLSGKNLKTKMLVPTDQAVLYFDRLGQAMSLQVIGSTFPAI